MRSQQVMQEHQGAGRGLSSRGLGLTVHACLLKLLPVTKYVYTGRISNRQYDRERYTQERVSNMDIKRKNSNHKNIKQIDNQDSLNGYQEQISNELSSDGRIKVRDKQLNIHFSLKWPHTPN